MQGLKKREKIQRENAVKEMISEKMSGLDMSNSELAKKTGISIRTLCERRRNSGDMRLKELWKIIEVLKPEDFYLRKIFDI